jgi:parallel beta-helix repeat protein
MNHEPADQNPPSTPPTDRRALLAGIGGLAAGAFLAGKANAGPLNPPAGPIAPTPGPEPRIPVNATNTPGNATALFRITQPGSYYLTANITGQSGKHGIEITASGVTLDLNGFRLSGVPGTLDGVAVRAFDGQGITVRNGSIQNWGDCGVEFDDLGGHPASGVVSGIDASQNTRTGILTSSHATVEQCTANENGEDGIAVSTGSRVTDCRASFNGADGIGTNTSCVVIGSNASANGERGFTLGIGNTITGCTAYTNGFQGFSAQGSSFLNCTAHTNGDHGFSLFEGNSLKACSAYRNTGSGFSASGSNSIVDCIATSNDLDGIRVSGNSTVRGNQCSLNGNGTSDGAGIHATSSDNRIEDNNCTDNDRGIDIDSAGSIILRNTCTGNSTNWTVVPGNVCLVVSGTQTLSVIDGDSGGISPGSTNPNANYTY